MFSEIIKLQTYFIDMHVNISEHVSKYKNINFANVTTAWIHNAHHRNNQQQIKQRNQPINTSNVHFTKT